MELKPSHRHQWIVSPTVQKFVENFDSDIKLRGIFLKAFKETLKGIEDAERSRLEKLVITTGLLPHPIHTVAAVEKATKRQKRDSPLHKFLLDSQVIGNAIQKTIPVTTINKVIKYGMKIRAFKKTFISLCPNGCFFQMSQKPCLTCRLCGDQLTAFPFLRVKGDLLKAWGENVLFEAWIYSLLRRKRVPCQPSLTIFVEGIDIGEIDLLAKDEGRFIIEITTGGSVVGLAHELFGKNVLLGGGYRLILLHSERIDWRIKQMLQSKGIEVIDNMAFELNSHKELYKILDL